MNTDRLRPGLPPRDAARLRDSINVLDTLENPWAVPGMESSRGAEGFMFEMDPTDIAVELATPVPVPTTITTSQNNWLPPDLWTIITASSTPSITGIQRPPANTYQLLTITNAPGSSTPILIPHTSGSSSTGNQIKTPDGTTYPVRPGDTIRLLYDPVTEYWWIIADPPPVKFSDSTTFDGNLILNGSTTIGSGGTLTTNGSATATFNGPVTFAGTVTGAGGTVDQSTCQGRLTASSSDPVGETFGSTLYYLPYSGNSVALYNGSAWELHTFSSVSISNSGLSDGNTYDVFMYDNSGTPTLELLVWTNPTTRATALVRQDGVWVKTGATTRRYLGTVYIPTGTNFTDLANTPQRWIWNYYNRVWREMSVQETEDTHDYTTATWRQYSADTSNKVEFVIGVSEDDVEAEAAATFTNTSAAWAAVGIGVSSTTANSARFHGTKCAASTFAKDIARYRGRPGIGYQYLAWLEISEATGTTTWHNTFFVSDVRGGLMAGLWC